MAELVLTVELVPRTSWYDNLRKVVSPDDWDRLRRDVYACYGHHCGICGASGRLACHEIWDYDDAVHRQTLGGFIALCDLCHHVKHIGLAGILASQGKLDYEKVVSHFCRVNNCHEARFDSHVDAAFAIWERRSRAPWTVDLGEWEALVK